jgi:4-hydroxybutyryl-CoA dehydratase/vinylacetyl-CoA-Delta-isomerase
MIQTKEDYLKSLKELKTIVYYRGKKVEDVTVHPAFLPHINAAAKTYELALDPQYEDLAHPSKPGGSHQKSPDAAVDLP